MIINLNEYYRKATTKELDFYHRKLYPLQDQVFQICSIYEKNIYLTGGTTLSRFYYQHRLSEDLDFFTTTNDLKLIANDLISRLNHANFQVQIDRLEVYFARFFILQDNWRLKIEFVREYNLYGDLLPTDKNIYINTIEDLGANKISAFEYIIDLYYITQNIDLERLFQLADLKRIPVDYEKLLTINQQGISGLVLMQTDINSESLINFIQDLKQKTEAEIKKKQI